MATQVEIARHLDLSERRLRDVIQAIGIDHTQLTLDEIRIAYIRDLRDKAAGRGGDDQLNLARARAEESQIKAAKLRLEYQREIGATICAEDAAAVIADWCRFANREYAQGTHKLVSEIQSEYGIEIESELVEKIAGATTRRIADHAEKLGRDLVEGIEPVSDAAD